MRFQRTILLSGFLLLAGAASRAQEAQPQGEPTVIRTETRLVLVDVVVTGKKGAYVEDLELKNFKVWEDNKEQQLKTFSFGADPKAPGGQQRYIVLFFDNSTMAMATGTARPPNTSSSLGSLSAAIFHRLGYVHVCFQSEGGENRKFAEPNRPDRTAVS